jgi:hypothetical protein
MVIWACSGKVLPPATTPPGARRALMGSSAFFSSFFSPVASAAVASVAAPSAGASAFSPSAGAGVDDDGAGVPGGVPWASAGRAHSRQSRMVGERRTPHLEENPEPRDVRSWHTPWLKWRGKSNADASPGARDGDAIVASRRHG